MRLASPPFFWCPEQESQVYSDHYAFDNDKLSFAHVCMRQFYVVVTLYASKKRSFRDEKHGIRFAF